MHEYGTARDVTLTASSTLAARLVRPALLFCAALASLCSCASIPQARSDKDLS
jgi:hypothetical protein